MKYYRLMDELNSPHGRWFLKSLNVVDENKISIWKFLSPAKVEIPLMEQLTMKIREQGKPLDFTFADFELIVVNERVASFFTDRECQLIPVEIEGLRNAHSYFVMVLLDSIDCLDEGRSHFEKWQLDDPIRPDLAGEYKSIYKLFVDSSRIKGSAIFRLGKYENVIIINEKLKKQFEENKISGVKFRDVT